MAQTGNAPETKTVLRLMARKSFAVGIWIQDQNGNPLDITDSQIKIVARKRVGSDVDSDVGNLITNFMAQMIEPEHGLARFELQASDLDWTPGEYLFNIVMIYQGYSSVIVDGVIQLEQNTEFGSVDETFVLDAAMSTALIVGLSGSRSIYVRTGPTLAPGDATFTWEDEQMLKELYAGAIAAGETLNADMIPDGSEKVMMTVAERALLSGGLVVDWDTGITGKPDFGDVALLNTSQILQPVTEPGGGIEAADIVSGVIDKDRIPLMSALRGVVITTSAPPGGNPGFVYLKYTP